MSFLNIYNYESSYIYLMDVFNNRQKSEESFSMRKWAKEMELKSHSLLNFLMTKRRPIRLNHVSFLSKGLKLSSDEENYLKALVQFEHAKNCDEKEVISLLLNELNPQGIKNFKVIDDFKIMSDWSYSAILSACDLQKNGMTLNSIAHAFKGKLSLSEVREKTERLKKAGLLIENNNKKFTPAFKKTSVPNDIKNEGIRSYHKSVLDLSKEAVDKVPLEEREFQSFAISMDKMKTPKVKKMIRNFLSRLEEETQNDKNDNVYQFNIQFFRLTQDSLQTSAEAVVKDVAPE